MNKDENKYCIMMATINVDKKIICLVVIQLHLHLHLHINIHLHIS
jgi:hypothetical protein